MPVMFMNTGVFLFFSENDYSTENDWKSTLFDAWL